jgi:hypothetical protein
MLNLLTIPGAEIHYDQHFLAPEEARESLSRA